MPPFFATSCSPIIVRRMAPFVPTFDIIEWVLSLAFVLLAVFAYRAKGTAAFLLLMLSSICYFLPRFAWFAVGLFFQLRGWNTSGSFRSWFRSWGSLPIGICHVLFLALIIAALISFIRERKSVVAPHA
jgi:hypothetical protein